MKLRPRAEVISFKGNKVFCGYNKDLGFCCFPGGGIDPNESAIQAAKRECLEEADRRLINCTIAHEPTVQVWPDGYAQSKGMKWAKGYQGGITYWMTGSTSVDPSHENPEERHEDFESIFEWKPIDEVLEKLKDELPGEWEEDVKVRLKILKQHQDLHKQHKQAALIQRGLDANVPVLSIRRQ